jgi:hypothetical protein
LVVGTSPVTIAVHCLSGRNRRRPGTIAPPMPKNNSNESNRKRQYSGALTGIAVQVVAIYWRI